MLESFVLFFPLKFHCQVLNLSLVFCSFILAINFVTCSFKCSILVPHCFVSKIKLHPIFLLYFFFPLLLQRCVVLDIEGTTTPISFVSDVLFPYARDNVGRHLLATYETVETQDDIKLLRSQVRCLFRSVRISISGLYSGLLIMVYEILYNIWIRM